VRACPLAELTAGHGHVVVRTPMPRQLVDALAAAVPGASVTGGEDESTLLVADADAATVGHVAHRAQVELHELRPAASDLEQVFLSLTGGAAT